MADKHHQDMASVEVWKQNQTSQVEAIKNLLTSYPYIAIDTEFPGFLHNTPRDATEEERYSHVKLNVDKLKIIQLGLTLFDDNGRLPVPCCSWQFNFREFDPSVDDHSEASIELLKRSGIDFHKNMRDGIESESVSNMIRLISGCCTSRAAKWITFHGLYDVAYLVKLLTNAPLPDTLPRFLQLVWELLGCVYDVKYMARFCDGLLGGELGLVRLANILKVNQSGTCHQAGHDSLLTAVAFSEIKKRLKIKIENLEGVLYGVESRKIGRFFDDIDEKDLPRTQGRSGDFSRRRCRGRSYLPILPYHHNHNYWYSSHLPRAATPYYPQRVCYSFPYVVGGGGYC